MIRPSHAVGIAAVAAYVSTILVANWLVRHVGPVSVGFGLVAPAGVYAAGFAFTFRDAVHETLGVRAVLAAIAAGCALSYLVSPTLAYASAAAFLLSELADLAVYTPLRERRRVAALAASNVVGACVDSAVFLWLAFHSEAFFRGQVVGKLWTTAIAVLVVTAATRTAKRTAW